MKKAILKKLYIILALCSRTYLRKTTPFIIGITGSVGKTSCRTIITTTLKKLIKDKKIYTSPKNFNSEIGMAFSIFQIEKYKPSIINLFSKTLIIIFKTLFSKAKYDILVLEYGVDYKYMDLLLKNAIPDIAIFTKLDSVHLENFDSIEDIGKEKFKLIYAAKKKVYLNYLDNFCKNEYENIEQEKSFYSKGNIKINNYQIINQDNNFFSTFNYKNIKIKTNIIGEENLAYILLALNIYEYISKKELDKDNIEIYYNLQAGRFTIFEGINNSILIDSSYNASPASMLSMINNTYKIKNILNDNFKVGFVLGDMRELGEKESKKEHTNLAKYILKSDFIFTVGIETKRYLIAELEKNNYKGRILNESDSNILGERLSEFLEENKNDNFLILFKGSQNTILLENAIKKVLKNKSNIKKLARQ